MTITTTDSSCTIKYTNAEWDFIESLSKEAKREILMGLATPYNYGYKKEK